MTKEPGLRADARLNHDRLLTAAAEAFATPGGDTSLKAIARSAGVGIGTLYRRFPTREHLVEAVYRAENAALAQRGAALLEVETPVEALRSWAGAFVDYMLLKDGMAEALPAILAADDDLRSHSRALLTDAVDAILAAGIADGTLRDLPAWDVLMLIGGITLVARNESQRDLAVRLIDLAVDGLRTDGARPSGGIRSGPAT